ncbi:MAG: hypothetical protein K1X72_02840 [Pyrinomonadaceae bacterium]|nr:hypothetical protein [Pyrinomonadaceae bacterium]
MLNEFLLPQGNLINTSVALNTTANFGLEIYSSVYLLEWNISDFEQKKVCDELVRLGSNKDFYLIITIDAVQSDKISEVIEAGADDFLIKPYTETELTNRLLIAKKTLKSKLSFSSNKALQTANFGQRLNFDSAEALNLLDLLNDSVIIFEPITNKILFVNNTACQTYFIKPEDFIGIPAENIWKL